MNKIWYIAWKNVWRNKPRSIVIIAAITLGTVAGVFIAGLLKGWTDQRIHASIYTEMSHVKIQNPQYLLNDDLGDTISGAGLLIDSIQKLNEVGSVVSRIKIMSVASTSRASAGIILVGVDTIPEKQVSDLYKYIVKGGGKYFGLNTKIPGIVISDKTAEILKIKNYRISQIQLDSLEKTGLPEIAKKLQSIKDKRYINKEKFEKSITSILTKREYENCSTFLLAECKYYQLNTKIVCSFSNIDNELGYTAFQVQGIYKTSNLMYDIQFAFVPKSDLAATCGLNSDQAHEIAIIINNADQNLDIFKKELKQNNKTLSVLDWKQLAPDAGLVSDFLAVYYLGIMIIIYLALAFGIINTMLMAIMERSRELGMLMAIGMKKSWVFLMIMLETVFLTFSGAIIGMIGGYILIHFTGKTGLNFSAVAEGFESVGWAALVYPSITISFFFQIVLLVFVVGVLSSVIPARKALKLPLIDILKNE
jgi:putative ABC transport system permease protein